LEAAFTKTYKSTKTPDQPKRLRPAMSPETRENQLVSLAVDLAEKQLLEGTASSQVITHYLKIGSTKERIEKEILEKQKDLIEAKTKSLQSAQRMEELYANALEAMRDYSGHNSNDDQ
jgi:2-phospho-L-lactate guanylyltransferase (CobY/MobA/RfbA family)